MPETTKRAVILMNLGSPASTAVKDVRSYLKEFLMDKRVIDSPFLLRAMLVHGIIAPFRAPKSAEAYQAIWTKDGSPLVSITRQLQSKLRVLVPEPVEVAMRYGSPSMKEAYDSLHAQYPDLQEVILLPLYPHYAMSSYETAVDHAETVHKKGKYPFTITYIKPFYNNEAYIHALAENIRPYLSSDHDHILFSYHSIPEGHILKSDVTGGHCLKKADCCTTPSPAHAFCYRHQCFETTRLVVQALGIPEGKYSVSFQSKLGRAEWLKPSTTAYIATLPAKGIRNLLVVSPSFVSDCLETLEEIAIREKENFLQSGGDSLTLIPCLNIHPLWVSAVAAWIKNS